MLPKVGLGLLVIAAGLLAAIVTRPDTFRVERSTTIAAPAEVVYGYVNDFHQSDRWNPFLKADPATKVSYAGAPAGVGAVYEWSSEKTGAGRQEILESRPHEYVRIKLDFYKPFEATSTVEYTVKPAPGGVSLSWVMAGDNTFLGKAMSLVADMDQIVGRDFEKGLADIKAAAEAEARTRPAAPAPAAAPAP